MDAEPQDILPAELLAEARAADEDQAKRLKALSALLATKRAEAVEGRAASGMEEIWTEDEDAYEGTDDAGRPDARMLKPGSTAGGLMRSRTAAPTRSTVFIRITAQYVDAAAARVSDMLLPTDDRCFDIRPEEVPVLRDAPAQAAPPEPMPAAVAVPPGQPAPPAPAPPTPEALAEQRMAQATASARKAERQIDAWLDECQWHAEKRKAIHDRAKLGVSVMKGPFPVSRPVTRMRRAADGTAELQRVEDIKPASKRIDPWNLYPDPACGENIHNGNYLFEKDFLTEKQLRALTGVPGYLADEIKEVIREGPNKAYADSSARRGNDRELYPVWYYYGDIKRSDLRAAQYVFADEEGGASGAGEGDSDSDGDGDDDQALPAIITLVNDRVIKATLSVLDSGSFPYDVCPWQSRAGSWAGIGVARQVREAQGGLNAAVRNLMDNAALSGGPMLIVNRALIRPVDGNWTLGPRKVFETTDDADAMADVRNAIIAVNVPSMQRELMQIIDFFLKMAEQTTGMPMLLQGQTGNAPDTLGGQLLANNNASTVLRRLARLDDDCSTEPHISRYYEYLLLHGEDESAKDNLVVHARGSSALVERDIQNHAVLGLLKVAVNPAFGIDPYKAAAEALKAQRLDPKRFQVPEDQFAQRMQQQPPPPPQVQVAQIREQGANQRLQLELQAEHGAQAGPGQPGRPGQAAAQVPGQPGPPAGQPPGQPPAASDAINVAHIRHRAEVDKAMLAHQAEREALQFKAQQAAMDRAHALQMKQFDYQMKLMAFSEQRQQTLDETRKQLADTAMRLDTQRELSQQAIAADLHKHSNPQVMTPPTEPAGRAAPGQAFEQ